VLAEYFDKDGDIDVAASSFYAEYSHRKDEAFFYLGNIKQLKYGFKTYVQKYRHAIVNRGCQVAST